MRPAPRALEPFRGVSPRGLLEGRISVDGPAPRPGAAGGAGVYPTDEIAAGNLRGIHPHLYAGA